MPPTGGAGAPPGAEPSTRERVARLKALMRRGLAHWKVALLMFVVAAGLGVFLAMTFVKRSYQSECTVTVRAGIRTEGGEDIPSLDRAARLGAKLKDMLSTRSNLEATIKKFKLYPKIVDSKGMLDAIDEMKGHVQFRPRQGGAFTLSFDSAEVDGVNTPELVRDVTQSLAESLIESYSNTNLTELKTSLAFYEQQAKASEEDVEKATTALTIFLSKHPEFAIAAQQPGTGAQLGLPTVGSMMGSARPKIPGVPTVTQPKIDPALLALYQSDPTLRVLYLQRAKAEDDLRASQQPQTPQGPAPATSAQAAALQEQIAQAQTAVDNAQKRVADTAADVASKSAVLAPEHPDMKAAQAAAANAASQLQQAKTKLAQLQAQRAAAAGGGGNPYDAPGGNPELIAKLKDINNQIGQREAELKAKGATPAPPTSTASPSASAPAPPPVPSEPVNPLVALETEWQRLLRDLGSAKSTLELRKKDLERVSMQVRAAQAASNDMMAITEPPFKPTRAYKGGRTPAAIGGVAFALIIAILYMAARVVFNDTIIDAADVEALNLIPVLGVVPKIDVAREPTAGGATGGV